MAKYCVTYSEVDNWGVKADRFQNRPPAEARLEEVRASGRFARLVRRDGVGVPPKEVARVNADQAPNP